LEQKKRLSLPFNIFISLNFSLVQWIEADGMGEGKGKNTKYHKAAVVGDTIGDPFKDTSGNNFSGCFHFFHQRIFFKSFAEPSFVS
jgi:hypothetical protein